jgi:hypothetical protein
LYQPRTLENVGGFSMHKKARQLSPPGKPPNNNKKQSIAPEPPFNFR